MPTKFTNDILSAAIEGFELQKKRIDDKIAEIRQMLGGGRIEPVATPEVSVGKRKKFSAAARKKMALAQKARWAKIKGDSEPPTPATPVAPKAKRKISAEGMKNIIAAQKKRWRVKKAAAKSAPAKKSAPKKVAAKAPTPTATKKVAVKKSASALA